MKIHALMLACIVVGVITGQTTTQCLFRVHVINGLTKRSVAGANVVLSSQTAEPSSGRTNADGSFSGYAASTGSYLCTVRHHGYRMTGVGMGKLVELKSGTQTDITVELEPLAVIAGRVLDQYGDPVRNAIVHTEDKLEAPGEGEYYESYSAGTTDDLGEYRIAEVEPGKHYVAVEFNTSNPRVRLRYQWPHTGGFLLYPDAMAFEQAQEVDVSAGATLRLRDVHLQIRRAVTIQGRVKPLSPSSGQQQISLRRIPAVALHSSPVVHGGVAEADGTFRVETFPGTYVLSASDMKTGKVSKPVTLEIGDQDITGLELDLDVGYELRGRIAVEGSQQIDYSSLLLNFGGQPVKLDSSGGFRADVFGATAFYTLQGLTGDWYVKDFRVSGKRITGRGFHVEPGTTDVLISLSPRGARLSIGFSIAPDGATAAMVVLLPEAGEIPDVESMISAQPDDSGRFILRGVPPGSYRVFTLDASNWVLAMRPDLLFEKHRNQAALITLQEGEEKSIAIPLQHINVEQ